MNIADPNILGAYLIEKGQLFPDEKFKVRELKGGVSCLTLLVQRTQGPDLVIKQARTRLLVKEDWFSEPERIHIEAAAMRALQELTPPGSVPKLIFEDEKAHLLAMEAVPLPHQNWKTMLLNGQVNLDHVRQFGEILAGIHRASQQNQKSQNQFADRHFFKTLRLEPYYAFTAGQVPAAATFLQQLIADTLAVRSCLVHGDYSPKNILVCAERLVLLDHEVMHFGDGAFDIGFSMTHLLSKARHVEGSKTRFLEAARCYWQTYRENFPVDTAWEARSVRHTIACMLARVRGKSPLEYFNEAERKNQEALCLQLITALPASMDEVIDKI